METEHAYEGEVYRWSCGDCGETHETESDPRGEEQSCDNCGATGIIGGN